MYTCVHKHKRARCRWYCVHKYTSNEGEIKYFLCNCMMLLIYFTQLEKCAIEKCITFPRIFSAVRLTYSRLIGKIVDCVRRKLIEQFFVLA